MLLVPVSNLILLSLGINYTAAYWYSYQILYSTTNNISCMAFFLHIYRLLQIATDQSCVLYTLILNCYYLFKYFVPPKDIITNTLYSIRSKVSLGANKFKIIPIQHCIAVFHTVQVFTCLKDRACPMKRIKRGYEITYIISQYHCNT